MTNEDKDGVLIRAVEALEKNRLNLCDPHMKSPLEIETEQTLADLKAYIDGVDAELGQSIENHLIGCASFYDRVSIGRAAKQLEDGVKKK